MDQKIVHYTSANVFPLKVCCHEDFLKHISKEKKIIPIHVQWIPTNRCNYQCTFCSCQKSNRSVEADYGQSIRAILKLRKLGMRAVTITGGGEPLLYPKINELIGVFSKNNIEVGLTTNGALLGRLKASTLKKLTWCRVSCSDEKTFADVKSVLDWAVNKAPLVDWSFSYVLTTKLNKKNLVEVVRYANKNQFTHIRIVSDLLSLDNAPSIQSAKVALRGMDDSRVIYQGRKKYTKGNRRCYISLLKPLIGPDLKLYPCCGVQYAQKRPTLDFPAEMRMGDVKTIEKIYDKQKYFKGSYCSRCYYDEYNQLIGTMLPGIKHKNFL